MDLSKLKTALLDGFKKYRKTVWFRITYLVLLGLIVAQLFPLTIGSAAACLTLVLMPVSVFVVPYWLGERKPRHLAVNALPVFLIAILFVAAFETQSLLGQDRPEELRSIPDGFSNTAMSLANGTVAPFRGTAPATFTFRVRLTTTANAAYSNFTVYVNLTVITGITNRVTPAYRMAYSPGTNSSNNTHNGTWYAYSYSIGGDSIYGYGFSVTDMKGNWTFAGPILGPITASSATYFTFFLYVTAFFMLIPFTFYYVILFMWWYTVRMRQSRTRMLGRATDIPKEEPPKPPAEASEPGKTTKAAAFTCTNCGADVSETDEKCPKCGAVFED